MVTFMPIKMLFRSMSTNGRTALSFCHCFYSQLISAFSGEWCARCDSCPIRRLCCRKHHFLMLIVSLECNAYWPISSLLQQYVKLSVLVAVLQVRFVQFDFTMIWTLAVILARLAIHVLPETCQDKPPMTFIIMRIRQQNRLKNNSRIIGLFCCIACS